jgi:hypothetical protein
MASVCLMHASEKQCRPTGEQGGSSYIINDLPQADAAASMMRARLLLTTCLAMSLDADRKVEVKN